MAVKISGEGIDGCYGLGSMIKMVARCMSVVKMDAMV